MANFKVKSKKQNNISKKPRVYFTCHPDDFKEHFEEICEDIFAAHDCAIYYTEDMSEVIDEENKETDLGRFNLFVVPVTSKLLKKTNRAMDYDVKYAMDKHIPLLPIMMESGLDPIYSEPDKFGELQYLNYRSTDETEIQYKDKLRKYLDSVLISDELANRVRAAFDAYIFLSYRKKDRKYANELMRLIHSNPECRDIAIWFDEFLTPGESFKENIEKILDDCKLFTLLVTPQLLEKVVDENGKERDNYVISTELPLARRKKEEKGTDIFAVEMEKTDREALSAINIEDYTNPKNADFRVRLLETISRMAITTNNTTEHNFLIGLAYLDGIDVEIDRERAANLIIDAANSDLPEAMVKLIAMYIDGNGVKQSNDEAEKWSKRLAAHYFKTSFTEEGTIKSKESICDLFSNYKNEYWSYTTKHFLITCDEKLSLDTLKLVYELLMSTDVREYTLLLDTCKELKCHKKGTQEMLVADILKKTANGTFPPYGPLFWYVPEYELYAPLLNALESFATDEQFTAEHFTNALALSRDVCWIFGHYNTVTEITESVNGKELFAKSDIKGIRRGLCELFYTGTTDELDGDDIYPRCFNIAEAKHWQAHGQGLLGLMTTAFEDELGLYSHEMFSELEGEYIGITAIPYDRFRIEAKLSKKSCKKLCGLFLSLPAGTALEEPSNEPLAINDKHLKAVYVPESSVSVYPWSHLCILDKSLMYFNTTVKIPDSVTEIGEGAFSGCRSLTEITIPDGVTEIGEGAFSGCTALTAVTIPDSVTIIESGLFGGCTSLTKINIPNSVTAISVSSLPERARAVLQQTVKSLLGAFENCTSLAEITIPNSVMRIGWVAFRGCTSLTEITIPDSVTEIAEWAFSGCTSLTEITIPDSVTEIGEFAFYGCRSLTKITIPDSVTEIGSGTFESCTSLTEVIIPDSVTEIGEGAFENCTSLTKINIPDSVTEIAAVAFSGCTSLTEINIPDSVTEIDVGAFENCTSLTKINIPDSVKGIGWWAFSSCTSLTEINIPDSVTEIGHYAFKGCTSLKEITIPDSVTVIGEGAFSGCTALKLIDNCPYGYTHDYLGVSKDCVIITRAAGNVILNIPQGTKVIEDNEYSWRSDLRKVIIPDGVTEIRHYAFKGCTSLTEITIPDGVMRIGWLAFKGCTSLKEITIPDGVTKIEEQTFSGCTSLTEVIIPDSVTEIGEGAFENCTSLTKINIPDSVTKIEKQTFSGCTSLTKITIPDSVKGIGDYAFSGCTSLTEITIPNRVTEIGWGAFDGCRSLTKITIPDSVTKIGWSAFRGCRSLTEITIPDSLEGIGSSAFEGCTSLTEITIPDGVTVIGKNAFDSCRSLTEITIPDGVTEVRSCTFKNCTALTKITIPDSVTKISWDGYLLDYGIYAETADGSRAFSGCSNLEEITIPNSVTEIGPWTFEYCTALKRISIPVSVRTIGDGAFCGCTGLKVITVSSRFEEDLERIFKDVDLSKIKINWL